MIGLGGPIGGTRQERLGRSSWALPRHPSEPGRLLPSAVRLLPPPGAGLCTDTHTQHHPSAPPVLSRNTAKMLLLLLGIIVLHVTVLVLLFVSTIVSVSTDFPLAPGYWQGREWLVGAWHGQKVLFAFVGCFTTVF